MITAHDIDRLVATSGMHRYTVNCQIVMEAFMRRAAIVDAPFMLKGSTVTRQYLGEPELSATQRVVQDLDWVCLTPFDPLTSRKVLNDWVTTVTETSMDDGVQFRSFTENSFWRMIDYAMDEDFPTVNTDLMAWVAGEEIELPFDVSFNLRIDPPPLPLLYQSLIGDSFHMPNTVPLELQLAWKLHQTIVRPRFKDLLDLTWLMRHNIIEPEIVWRALQEECIHDNADVRDLAQLLDVESPDALGLAKHREFARPFMVKVSDKRATLNEAWAYWRHDIVPAVRYPHLALGSFSQDKASQCVVLVDALPQALHTFLAELVAELRRKGLANLIEAAAAVIPSANSDKITLVNGDVPSSSWWERLWSRK